MLQFSWLRTAIIAVVAFIAVVFTISNFQPGNPNTWPGWIPHQRMVLGLDLQGGSHLLLQVNREGIVTERIKDLRRDARSVLANQNGIGNLITTGPDSITV